MARLSEFVPGNALDRAMRVFWEKGYSNTSIADLVTATGVSRHGLYGEYSSKHGLFLASLEHYMATVVSEVFGIVEQAESSLAAIGAYFDRLIGLTDAVDRRMGCLMAMTAGELAPHDPLVAEQVEKFRSRLQRGFCHALGNARRRGEVSASLDLEESADFLTGVVQGVLTLVRSHASRKLVANVVSKALESLK